MQDYKYLCAAVTICAIVVAKKLPKHHIYPKHKRETEKTD